MNYYPENAFPRETIVGQQSAQQLREAEKILSEFSSSLSNYALLLDQLTDRMEVLCVKPTGSQQKDSAMAPNPCMSPLGVEFSSRIAGFDEMNRRLRQVLESLVF